MILNNVLNLHIAVGTINIDHYVLMYVLIIVLIIITPVFTMCN